MKTQTDKATQCCKFCGEPITLHDTEYVTYNNREAAHYACHETNELFREANNGDFADDEQ